ncbi:hypothetical protein FF38_09592 [Lucilia cuprina]|uniref:Uncharacterized protein n=1 Tax=Lucilia cuprina TaxID=7375 RepID=A0A0L0CP55_LUCCU|nr:hypothetical protein FF38_09592 [Lucilia cuprina]
MFRVQALLTSVLQKEIGDLNSKIDAFINKVDGEQTSIRQALADTVSSFKLEMASCLKEMKSEIVDCNKLIHSIDSSTTRKITALEVENNILHKRLNRADIVVNGLPDGIDDLLSVAVKIGSIYNVPIGKNDVNHIRYFNKRKSILIKLNSDEVMKECPKTRSLKVSDVMGGDIALRVYLNDHFSPAAAQWYRKKKREIIR